VDNILSTVRGKVFMHPVTKEDYGPIRVPPASTNFSTLDGTSFAALAEDSGGNYFTTREDGAVWFWDHETDDLVSLASSVSEFVTPLHRSRASGVESASSEVCVDKSRVCQISWHESARRWLGQEAVQT